MSGASTSHSSASPEPSWFPNSVWEPAPGNSVSRPARDGKRSFPEARSQTEFGNEGRCSPWRLAAWALLLLAAAGCRQQMAKQPRYNSMSESPFWGDNRSARPLEAGTVARGHLRNPAVLFEGIEGTRWWNTRVATRFPFQVTETELKRGQELFNIRCAVCHDRVGHGQGKVVQRGYVQPPSYHLEPVRSQPVGHYFRAITHGWGAMPSLAEEVPDVVDRWSI